MVDKEITYEISANTHESIDLARNGYLKDQMEVTDEELSYLNNILRLQYNRRELIFNGNTPSMILDNFLYQGDMDHATNFDLLNNLGIRHIINICNHRLPKLITGNFHVLWINIFDDLHRNIFDDLHRNIHQYFTDTNEYLYTCKKKNEKVLVHCHMGISRSSSIVLAYLIKYHHNTLIEAYDYLLDRRQLAAPNYGFFIQLIRYKKKLHQNVVNHSLIETYALISL